MNSERHGLSRQRLSYLRVAIFLLIGSTGYAGESREEQIRAQLDKIRDGSFEQRVAACGTVIHLLPRGEVALLQYRNAQGDSSAAEHSAVVAPWIIVLEAVEANFAAGQTDPAIVGALLSLVDACPLLESPSMEALRQALWSWCDGRLAHKDDSLESLILVTEALLLGASSTTRLGLRLASPTAIVSQWKRAVPILASLAASPQSLQHDGRLLNLMIQAPREAIPWLVEAGFSARIGDRLAEPRASASTDSTYRKDREFIQRFGLAAPTAIRYLERLVAVPQPSLDQQILRLQLASEITNESSVVDETVAQLLTGPFPVALSKNVVVWRKITLGKQQRNKALSVALDAIAQRPPGPQAAPLVAQISGQWQHYAGELDAAQAEALERLLRSDDPRQRAPAQVIALATATPNGLVSCCQAIVADHIERVLRVPLGVATPDVSGLGLLAGLVAPSPVFNERRAELRKAVMDDRRTTLGPSVRAGLASALVRSAGEPWGEVAALGGGDPDGIRCSRPALLPGYRDAFLRHAARAAQPDVAREREMVARGVAGVIWLLERHPDWNSRAAGLDLLMEEKDEGNIDQIVTKLATLGPRARGFRDNPRFGPWLAARVQEGRVDIKLAKLLFHVTGEPAASLSVAERSREIKGDQGQWDEALELVLAIDPAGSVATAYRSMISRDADKRFYVWFLDLAAGRPTGEFPHDAYEGILANEDAPAFIATLATAGSLLKPHLAALRNPRILLTIATGRHSEHATQLLGAIDRIDLGEPR